MIATAASDFAMHASGFPLWLSLSLFVVVAFFAGVAKTGIPAMGTLLAVVFAAATLPRVSTGYLLPLLLFADIIAAFYWRKEIPWRPMFAIVPWLFTGVAFGFAIMAVTPNERIYGVIFGVIAFVVIGLDIARKTFKMPVPTGNPATSGIIGIAVGALSMMTNAEGPIMALYFISVGIAKDDVVGVAAWTYLFLNLFKLPFSAALGLVSVSTFALNLLALPVVALGALTGIVIMKRVPPKTFDTVIRAFTIIGALKLLIF